MTRSRITVGAGVLTSALLLLAGCGAGSESPALPEPTTSASVATATPPETVATVVPDEPGELDTTPTTIDLGAGRTVEAAGLTPPTWSLTLQSSGAANYTSSSGATIIVSLSVGDVFDSTADMLTTADPMVVPSKEYGDCFVVGVDDFGSRQLACDNTDRSMPSPEIWHPVNVAKEIAGLGGVVQCVGYGTPSTTDADAAQIRAICHSIH